MNQKDLFEGEGNSSVVSDKRENESQWNQFCKLGEMMGDGLHHESDGKWIIRDYNKLARLLIPELKEQEKERRKLKSENRDKQMANLMSIRKCTCGGDLKQKRSGTKVCYCSTCNARYVARHKK